MNRFLPLVFGAVALCAFPAYAEDSVRPPYTASAVTSEGFAEFTVLDSNTDGQTWKFGGNCAYVMMHNQHATDDWLITRPVHLEAGTLYYVTTEVYGSLFSTEKFELKGGLVPTPEGMTLTLIEPTALVNVGDATEYTATFTPETTGDYYIGLHAISDKFQFALHTKGITILDKKAEGLPSAPVGISVDENLATGEVTLSWEPVHTDVKGNEIDPAKVRYSLYSIGEDASDGIVIAEDLAVCAHTFKAIKPDSEQDFYRWAISAVTEVGENVATSEYIPLGKPYQGLEDSFSDGEQHYIYGIDNHGTLAVWALGVDNTFIGMGPYDDDNGFLYFQAARTDESADFFTGKISLEGMPEPCLKFFANPYWENSANRLTVQVREAGEACWHQVYDKAMSEIAGALEWKQVFIPLDDYAGKTIQISIGSKAVERQFTFIDKLAVEPCVGHDLRVNAVKAPHKGKAGYEMPMRVTVENKGMETAGEYSVEIYAADRLVGAASGEAGLEPDAEDVVTVPVVMDRFATEGLTYTAKVVYDKDQVSGNDVGPAVFVPWEEPLYPGVQSLSGNYGPVGNTLAWTVPDLDCPDRPMKADFEDGYSWEQEYEDWLFVDMDGFPTGGISETNIPGIRPGKDVSSFFIFDASDPELFNTTFSAVSGKKFLASLYCMDDKDRDDWAISPELTGKSQTISFYAKSYRDIYPERLEVWYGTGSTDPKDFTLLEDAVVESVPYEWTRYEWTLPDGADRFAIRSCAPAGMLLMIDDVEFVAASASKDLELKGYDVWRDREKLNREPLSVFEWEDSGRNPDERHLYTVIPVYNRGEGQSAHVRVSNPLSLQEVTGATVISRQGRAIEIRGAEGERYVVTDAAGIILARGIASDCELVRSGSGLRIVRVGNRTARIMMP